MLFSYRDLLPAYLAGDNIDKHSKVITEIDTLLEDKINLLAKAYLLERPILVERVQEDTDIATFNIHLFNRKGIKKVVIEGDYNYSIEFNRLDGVTSHLISFTINDINRFGSGMGVVMPLFFVTLETYDDGSYVKGYPELESNSVLVDSEDNEILLTDNQLQALQHDEFLDNMGSILNVPRRTYISFDMQYISDTTPAYMCKNITDNIADSCSEDDYEYYKRLKFFITNYQELHLPELILHLVYGYPVEAIEFNNRDISICHMNKDDMGARYMWTKNYYNECTYLYKINDTNYVNISTPSTEELTTLLSKYIPITRNLVIEKIRETSIQFELVESVDDRPFRADISVIDEEGNLLQSVPLIITIDETEYNVRTGSDGILHFITGQLTNGVHNISITFEKQDIYQASSYNTLFIVNRAMQTELTLEFIGNPQEEHLTAILELKDVDNFPVGDAPVHLTLFYENMEYQTNMNTGIEGAIMLNDWSEVPWTTMRGDFTILAEFNGKDDYRPSNLNTTVYVAPYPTWSYSLTDNVALTANCKFGLTDPIKHTPVRYGTIKLYAFDTIDTSRLWTLVGEEIPDNNGFVNFNLSGLGGSTYTLRAEFSGSPEGAPSTHTETGVVLNKIGTIMTSQMISTVEGDTKISLALYRTDDITLMTNRTVILNVFDRPNHMIKYYEGVTTAEQSGWCLFNITDLPAGTYGIIYYYNGDNYFSDYQSTYTSLIITPAPTIITDDMTTTDNWTNAGSIGTYQGKQAMSLPRLSGGTSMAYWNPIFLLTDVWDFKFKIYHAGSFDAWIGSGERNNGWPKYAIQLRNNLGYARVYNNGTETQITASAPITTNTWVEVNLHCTGQGEIIATYENVSITFNVSIFPTQNMYFYIRRDENANLYVTDLEYTKY